MIVKQIFITFLVFYAFTTVHCQHIADTISMIKQKGKYRFYYQNKEVRFIDLRSVLESNEEATKSYRGANSFRVTSSVFGGFTIMSVSLGVLFGVSQASEDTPFYKVPGFIAGTITGAVSFVLYSVFRYYYISLTEKAIKIYNEGTGLSFNRNIELEFGLTSNGFGIVMNF